MEQEFLFNQKKIVAKNTLAMKTEAHGFKCEIELPENYLTAYGEESGHITYKTEEDLPKKVLLSNGTQQTMKSVNNPLSSTENQDLYIMMFEDNILPRNTRLKIYMQDNSYKQLQIRDNIKNEGTFVIHQELVPCINTVDDTNPNIGNNVEGEWQESVNPLPSIGNNL